MRKMNYKKIRSRRGISLAEVMIALAIITIVSAAALSLTLSSAKVDAMALRTTQITMAGENALECFRYADNDGDFGELLKKTGNYTSSVNGVYTLEEEMYTITVNADYTNNTMSFVAKTNDEAQKELHKYSFTKGN